MPMQGYSNQGYPMDGQMMLQYDADGKYKTELCKNWIETAKCRYEDKCRFAHGQDELQKKKGLSRQYLTSVCKNFLEHPSKCTYGQRCIFQHPTHDVRERQPYTSMM